MFISCKVPKPLLPHLSLGPSTGSSLSSEPFLPYSQLYLDYPNLPPQSTPTFLPLLCKKKKYISVTVLGFLTFMWASPSSSSAISIWNYVQSTLVCTIEIATQSEYKCASISYYVNLSTFFTSHHLVILYLSRVTYVTSTVLSSKTVPTSIKRSINNKT